MHEDQRDVTVALVRRLVAAQFPEWAGLPITPVDSSGTVNAMFRLGDALAVRIPLRGSPAAVQGELDREAEAARELAGLAVPVPRRVAAGAPGEGLPTAWTVQTWLRGAPADGSGSSELAADLAALVTTLRALPLNGRRFRGEGRGGELTDHDGWVGECLRRSTSMLDTVAAGGLWNRLRTLPRPAREHLTHGDLIPPNLLLDGRGRLGGLLDLASFGPADPALDLVCAWHCLETGPRERFRHLVAVDDAEWGRGQAWALEQALGIGWYYARSNSVMSRLGLRTTSRILADRAAP